MGSGGVGFGEFCVLDYCIVWFTDCLRDRVVFNTDSSTLVLLLSES